MNGQNASVTSGTLAFTTPATPLSNTGSYAINGSGLSANSGNYTFTQAAANETAFTINPALLTYTATPASGTYGSAIPALSGTVTGFVNSQIQSSATSGTLAFTTPATPLSNTGTYAINGSGLTANNGNYAFGQAAANETAFTINPALLTYTATPASGTYGSAIPALSGTVTGFVNGQNASVTSGTLAFTTSATPLSNTGTYAINGSGLTANNGNYAFGQADANETAFTINPALLTYTATPACGTYGSAIPALSGTVTGFVNGQNASVTSGTLAFTTPATPLSNTGTYGINGSGLTANNGNYTFGQAAANETAFTINPALLTYTASPATGTYGSAIPALSGTVTGFVNGQNASVTSGLSPSPPPPHRSAIPAATPSTAPASPPTSATTPSAKPLPTKPPLTINPALLTYTATPASGTYGSAIPALSGTVTGFVNGQNASVTSGALAFTTPATPLSNTGSYAINGSGLTANYGNYTFAQAAANETAFTINPALLTYTASPASGTYGSAIPAFRAPSPAS